MTKTESNPNRFAKYSTPRWKPEEIGDAIAGTLVAVNELTGRTTGDVFPVIVLATDEGETEVFCSPVDLKRQLAEKNPKDGEWVDIELIGFKQTAMGEMKCFRLDVTRGSRKHQPAPDAPPPPDDGDVPPEDEPF